MAAHQDGRPVGSSRLRVICTRQRSGQLERLIDAAGFEPIHLPLIEVVDTDDSLLSQTLDSLGDFDWLVVTSRHGAKRVAPAAALHPTVRLGAVGRATAEVLAEGAHRIVDVVPDRQNAAGLADALGRAATAGQRLLLAQADRADSELADRLAAVGFAVDVVEAYRTLTREPTAAERESAQDAAALTLASGSAAQAWAAAFGADTPRVVVAIGPATAAAATRSGLKVTHVAVEHSIEGLALTVSAALGHTGDPSPCS